MDQTLPLLAFWARRELPSCPASAWFVRGDVLTRQEATTLASALKNWTEMGSAFRIFAVAQIMEFSLVNPDTVIDTRGPTLINGIRVADPDSLGPLDTVSDVITGFSKVGTARIISMVGPERQRELLSRLGFTGPSLLEMPEARMSSPLVPDRWSEVSTTTISFGYGVASRPTKLDRTCTAIANGGLAGQPTLLRQDAAPEAERVLASDMTAEAGAMLRRAVTEGAASFIDLPTYQVAGKIGTANKPKAQGGYYYDRVIAFFTGSFPCDDPQYTPVVSLDEPIEMSGPEPLRTARWTAGPVATEFVHRTVPLLGLRSFEPARNPDVMIAANG